MCPRGPDVRRAIAILLVLAALVAVLATGLGAGGDDGNYEVRAIFDNAAFLVKGEQVRIAGATVGTVSDVEVSTPDEVVHEDGKRRARQGRCRPADRHRRRSRTSARTRRA